ncbi:transcriptional regulator, LysR family [Bordetella bronchiseptica M85/00/2]|nr:transcriptional regulator, LysR family [Bordetella bronchiseptica M85/00/2]
MSRLEDLETFIHIAEAGSLTQAARRLDRSLQAVSRTLAALEQDLGVQLVHRSTRRLALSEAGQAYYHRIKPAIAAIAQARLDIAERRAAPSGTLRVGAPVLFGPDFLVPVIADYMRAYPQVHVDLQLTDAFADLADEGLDLVVRIGDLPDSGLQGRRLGALRRVVFGAPAYFAQHGRPTHPEELRQHAPASSGPSTRIPDAGSSRSPASAARSACAAPSAPTPWRPSTAPSAPASASATRRYGRSSACWTRGRWKPCSKISNPGRCPYTCSGRRTG